MSEEQSTEPSTEGAPPVAQVAAEPVRNDPPPQDPRRRLRELLAIPDHQRTDAIWDEIIELEISLAPGNRIQPGGAHGDPGRRPQGGQNQSQGRRQDQQPRRQDGNPGNKPSKRFFKKPKRPPGAQPKT